MSIEDKKLEFPSNITIATKKVGKVKYQHWYVTIPSKLRSSIEWNKGKLFKVTLEKF